MDDIGLDEEDVLRKNHQGDSKDRGSRVEALDGGAGGVGALGLFLDCPRVGVYDAVANRSD